MFFRRLFLFAVLAAALCVSCHDPQVTEGGADGVKVGVTRVSASSEAPERAEYVGTIEAGASVDVAFSVGGRLVSLPVKEGQRVRRGQLLASIDNGSATSSYLAAKATLDRAEDGWRRAKQVYDKGSLPEVKWIEVQTQLDQARSLCDIARKNLDDCSLCSPISGTVARRFVEVGATVSPMQGVVRVMDLSCMCVRVSVPETDIMRISVGDTAGVVVSSADSVAIVGIVDEKGVAADPISHSYLVRVRLLVSKEELSALLPGMVCRVMVGGANGVMAANKGAIPLANGQWVVVPNRAVQIDPSGERFVWVVSTDSTAERRAVVIGDLTSKGVCVASGLSHGDIVITDGTNKIASGTKVRY